MTDPTPRPLDANVSTGRLRLGIVSSTDVSCGNAAFTEVLARTIGAVPGVTVELLSLDLDLTGSTGRRERRLADTHIAELADRARGLDAVNIQLEPALLGTDPKDVRRRLEMLLDANPRSFVTFHAVRTVDNSRVLKRQIVARVAELRFREALGLIKSRAASRSLTAIYRGYVDAVCSRGRATRLDRRVASGCSIPMPSSPFIRSAWWNRGRYLRSTSCPDSVTASVWVPTPR